MLVANTAIRCDVGEYGLDFGVSHFLKSRRSSLAAVVVISSLSVNLLPGSLSAAGKADEQAAVSTMLGMVYQLRTVCTAWPGLVGLQ